MKRLSFGAYVDKVFWAATIWVATQMAGKVDTISTNIAELNVKMAAIVERTANQEKRIDSLEGRIQAVESARPR